MNQTFDSYSRYYDLLYTDKDYDKESQYIISTLRKLGIANGDLLEFGSGTGRHGRILSKDNFNVHGIEKSSEMVLQARQTDKFTCEQGDICDFNLDRKFDAVVSLFHVVSYLTSNESMNAVFKNVSKHLNSQGIFLFDVWYTPAVYYQYPSTRIKRVEDDTIEVTRISEPSVHANDNIVDVNFTVFIKNKSDETVQVLKEMHRMRHFSVPELVLLGEFHGFNCVLVEEFLTGNAPGTSTWGVCFAFKKV